MFLHPLTIPLLPDAGFSLLKFILDPRTLYVGLAVNHVVLLQVLKAVAGFVNVYNAC
jgi:hypothetical protein